MLFVTGQLDQIPEAYFVGELSLDGSIRPIRGVVSIAELVLSNDIKTLYVPHDNFHEASLIDTITVIPVKHLSELPHLFSKSTIPLRNKKQH